MGMVTWVPCGLCLILLCQRGVGSGAPELVLRVEPQDQVVSPGRGAVLDCEAEAHGGRVSTPPSISWRTADGEVLTFIGDSYRSQLPNGSLYISAFGEDGSEQEYQCVASLESVGSLVSRTARLRQASAPRIVQQPADLRVFPGQTAYFACVTDAVPAASVSWLKDGRPLQLDAARMAAMPSGALEVDEAQASDQGTYLCNASGSLSKEAKLSINMDIESGESIMAPVFIATPRSAVATAGSNVTLDCAANGNPRPEISWLKDGVTIDMALLDSRFRRVGTGGLQVLNVEESDAGDYQCRAENREDSVDASATVQVQVPPRFIKKPVNKVALEKQDLELECEVYGKPDPKVYWAKNGDNITQNDYLQVVGQVSGTYNLRILGLMSTDSGVFQCLASNPAGNIQSAARLTVVSSDSELPALGNKTSSLEPRFTVSSSSVHNTLTSRSFPRPFNAPPPLHSEPSDPYDPYDDGDLDDELDDDDVDDDDDDMDDDETDDVIVEDSEPGRDLPERTFGEDESEKGSVPGTPSAPRDLEAVITTTRFVTLRWKEPEHKNGDIDTYSVFYRQDNSQRERVMNTSRSRLEEVNIPGLQPDRKYHFRVRAYNHRGAGPSSTVLTVTTKPEVHVPSPPLDVTATPLSSTSLLVKWRPPAASDSPILHYKLFHMQGESAEEHHVETADTHYELTGLDEYTEYSLWVIAVNRNGQGASTEEVVARTLSAPPSDAPQNVTVEAAGSTSVVVRWEPPPKEGQNGVITGYKLKYRKKDRRGKGDTVTAAGNRRLYTLTDLEPSSTYVLRLYAMNVNGTGPGTESFTVETFQKDLDESSVPDIPSLLKLRPMTNSIHVSWMPPHNQNIKIRGYTIGWGKGFPDEYTQLLDDKARTFTIESLEANSEYVISVRAFNEKGDGQPKYESARTREESTPEPSTPLIPPVGLKAIVLSSSSVVVYWTDTTLSQSQFVTDNRYYSVRYSSHSQRYKYFNSTDLNCMIDDLKPHTQYEFTVKVVKGRRQSPWSMVVLNTTFESIPSSSPRDLTVVAIDNNPTSVNLNWQPPRQPNGQITGYTIFYTTVNPQPSEEEWVLEGVNGDKLTTTIRGLTPSTTYYFKIQARNSKGYGPSSSVVSFSTLSNADVVSGHETTNKENRGLNSTTLIYVVVGVISLIIVIAMIGIAIVCCRRPGQGPERSKKGYMKGNTKTSKPDIKPPDLWIHHDQMELKNMDKCGNNHGNHGNPSTETSSSSHTLPRSSGSNNHQDYSSDGPPKYQHHTNSLDKRNYISSYVGNSHSLSDEKSSTARRVIKAKPITLPVESEPLREPVATATPISNGTLSQTQTDGRPLYPRSTYSMARAHVTVDSTGQTSENPYSLQGGYDTVSSLPGAVGAPGPGPGPPVHLHHTPNHTTSYSPSPLSSQLPQPPTMGLATVQECNSSSSSSAGSTIGSNIKRLQGHPLKSFSVPAPPPPPQSAPCTPQQKHLGGVPGLNVRPLQQGSSSPYKKPNLLTSVTAVPVGGSRGGPTLGTPTNSGLNEPGRLQTSYSTEELNQEMANLEGLMKDLNAITASEFEC